MTGGTPDGPPEPDAGRLTLSGASTDPLVVERLLLVSQVALDRAVAPLVLDQPVLLRPGQRCRLDVALRVLVVEDEDGRSRAYPCWFATGPDALR